MTVPFRIISTVAVPSEVVEDEAVVSLNMWRHNERYIAAYDRPVSYTSCELMIMFCMKLPHPEAV